MITQKPRNKDIKEGSKAKFEVKAKGKPLPEVTWYVNYVEHVQSNFYSEFYLLRDKSQNNNYQYDYYRGI